MEHVIHNYFAIQYYGHCFCGDEPYLGRELSFDACDTRCTANGNEVCRGVWKNSVYKVRNIVRDRYKTQLEKATRDSCAGKGGVAGLAQVAARLAAFCRDDGCDVQSLLDMRSECQEGVVYFGLFTEGGFIYKYAQTRGVAIDLRTGEARGFKTECHGVGLNAGLSLGGMAGIMVGGTLDDDFPGWILGAVDTDFVLVGGVGVAAYTTLIGVSYAEASYAKGVSINAGTYNYCRSGFDWDSAPL